MRMAREEHPTKPDATHQALFLDMSNAARKSRYEVEGQAGRPSSTSRPACLSTWPAGALRAAFGMLMNRAWWVASGFEGCFSSRGYAHEPLRPDHIEPVDALVRHPHVVEGAQVRRGAGLVLLLRVAVQGCGCGALLAGGEGVDAHRAKRQKLGLGENWRWLCLAGIKTRDMGTAERR